MNLMRILNNDTVNTEMILQIENVDPNGLKFEGRGGGSPVI